MSYLHLPRQVEQRTFFGEEPAVDPEGSIDAITSLQALTNPHTPLPSYVYGRLWHTLYSSAPLICSHPSILSRADIAGGRDLLQCRLVHDASRNTLVFALRMLQGAFLETSESPPDPASQFCEASCQLPLSGGTRNANLVPAFVCDDA